MPDWNETEEDLEEMSAWNDNWDNDELNDDFSKQLRWVPTAAEPFDEDSRLPSSSTRLTERN
jgi:hypothetical protein